jgi:hypothetical protein
MGHRAVNGYVKCHPDAPPQDDNSASIQSTASEVGGDLRFAPCDEGPPGGDGEISLTINNYRQSG